MTHEAILASTEMEADFPEFMEFFSHVWYKCTAAKLLQTGCQNVPMTCGFQHVCVGETNRGRVKGLHNWQRIYILERQGRLNTNRVIRKSPDFHLAALNFTCDGASKPHGSTFFGLPLDFELCFLFVAFLLTRNGSTTFLLAGTPVTVTCYDLAVVEDAMATAFFKY